MAECYYCGAEIEFNDDIVGQNERPIPLNEGTEDQHRCQEGIDFWLKNTPIYCHGCGEELTFFANKTSHSKRLIPHNKKDGEPHKCNAQKRRFIKRGSNDNGQ